MSTIDQQFIEYIVKSLVGHPDDVVVERLIDEKGVLLTLTVNPEDLGRVIGKRGMTAQSLRTLLRALGTKNDARYNLKIVNNDDYHKEEHTYAPRENDDSRQPVAPTVAESETPVEDSTDEAVDNSSDYSRKTREELADLDDLDI
jgi:hypothetical protein